MNIIFIKIATLLFLFSQQHQLTVNDNVVKEDTVGGTAGNCWAISQPKEHPFIHFDVSGGTAVYQDTIYMIGGNGSMWDRSSYQWELWKGTHLDKMQKEPTPVFKENFPNYISQTCEGLDPAFCNWQFYWPMGLYIDKEGVFYTIAYTEYNFKNGWKTEAKERRLGLAKSFDKGKSWNYFGDIITQNKQDPPPNNKTYNGAGDISFFVADDGYAYIYYKTGFYDNSTLIRDIQNISVARSPLSAKFKPGSWTKFYKGYFHEPGINGKEDYVFSQTDLVTITYNTYLKKFVLFGGSVSHDAFVTFCDDLSKQNWTPGDFTIDKDIRIWYFWTLDPLNKQPFKTGKNFRIYTTGVKNGERVGYYKTVSLSKKDK
jgi:hypothetical protein